MSWRARAFDLTTEFIELAGRVNVGMPHYAVGRIVQTLNDVEEAAKGSPSWSSQPQRYARNGGHITAIKAFVRLCR